MKKFRFQYHTIVIGDTSVRRSRFIDQDSIVNIARLSSRPHRTFSAIFPIKMQITYLLSFPLVSLFSLLEEFFLLIVPGVYSVGVTVDDSQRNHQSMTIRYQDEPGLDVKRLQLIQ